MKLCPQCDFIYEDDQRCCDMDGMELVYEPTLDRLLAKSVEGKSRFFRISPRLRRLVQVLPFTLATLVFAAAVSIFYIGYPRLDSHSIIPPASASNPVASESALSNSPLPLRPDDPIPGENTSTPDSAAPAAPDASRPSHSISSTETEAGIANSQSEIARPGIKPARNANNPSLPSKGRNVAATKAPPALSVMSLPRVKPLPRLKPLPKPEENRKRDSRVGSFFKKTGRILTKPFKR
jgi:hypothetical protein